MKRTLLTLCALSVATAPAFAYFNDFEGAVGSEWSDTTTDVTPVGARRFLGQFGSGTVTLTLNTTIGQNYTLCFDLFIINSWDGNVGGVGPDYFDLDVDGNLLMSTTFSNTEEVGYNQSYSATNLIGAGNFVGGTDADEKDTLGYNYYGNTVYKFGGATNPAFNFIATNAVTTINWTGSNLQGIGDESWGLDNVKVVPEPATLTLLGLGLAAIARKKRKA